MPSSCAGAIMSFAVLACKLRLMATVVDAMLYCSLDLTIFSFVQEPRAQQTLSVMSHAIWK
jgi:hypothetical protein